MIDKDCAILMDLVEALKNLDKINIDNAQNLGYALRVRQHLANIKDIIKLSLNEEYGEVGSTCEAK